MKPDELEEIRADIWAEPWKDPSLFPDLLNRTVTELGIVATGGVSEVGRPGVDPTGYAIDWEEGAGRHWAASLLRLLQHRAKSGIPFGEPPPDEAPYWSEHL